MRGDSSSKQSRSFARANIGPIFESKFRPEGVEQSSRGHPGSIGNSNDRSGHIPGHGLAAFHRETPNVRMWSAWIVSVSSAVGYFELLTDGWLVNPRAIQPTSPTPPISRE